MVRRRVLFSVLLVITLLLPVPEEAQIVVTEDASELKPVKGNYENRWGCVVCTFVAGLVSQLRQLHQVSAKDALDMLCGFLPPAENLLCLLMRVIVSKKALPLIDANKTADVVCQALAFCVNLECHLFPRSNEAVSIASLRRMYELENTRAVSVCALFPDVCLLNSGLRPAKDADGDLFSTIPNGRGSYWRGRDCDDNDPMVYPGRDTLDIIRDENCNGIYGVDNVSGKSYEELWCSKSSSMGVIAIGDSVTAHFGIPREFVTVQELSRAVFANVTSVIANEMDWPMLSSITGFANTSDYTPIREGPMHSVFSELLKRNKCNHRDYQNLGVNGATTKRLDEMMEMVARNRTQSVKPVFMFLSMIGNDVCDRPPAATTPEEYYTRLTRALEKAEDLLPSGSYVLISPIVDGRILYNELHNRTHPIGSLYNDVTYADFYDFLNCMDISPCWGWLNTNETVRNTTWKVAQSLNANIPRILNESAGKFKNIMVYALDDVIEGALRHFDGPRQKLIEPVDGFHPSQLGAAVLGEYIFNKTLELGIVPPVNPFNKAITDRFGDQGGF